MKLRREEEDFYDFGDLILRLNAKSIANWAFLMRVTKSFPDFGYFGLRPNTNSVTKLVISNNSDRDHFSRNYF